MSQDPNIDYRSEFIEIFNKNINRKGAAELLAWLQNTDFFTAPASTRYHGACEAGLVMHSINVYNCLLEQQETEQDESIAVCALLHDICKTNFYKISTRNVKNEQTGVWEKVPYYTIEDEFPYGHGEKSVYMIERFMKLSPAEAMAIRWHMGGFDEAVKGGSFAIGNAYYLHPIAVKLHIADLKATYLLELGTSSVKRQ